jgi:hypothetical protein
MSPAVVTLLASWRHSPRIYVTSEAHDQPDWLNGCMLHLWVWHAANQPASSSCCSVFVLYIVLLFIAGCSVSCRAPCGITWHCLCHQLFMFDSQDQIELFMYRQELRDNTCRMFGTHMQIKRWLQVRRPLMPACGQLACMDRPTQSGPLLVQRSIAIPQRLLQARVGNWRSPS